MGIIKKNAALECQVNIKVSNDTLNRYREVKKRCRECRWEFSLQPEFSTWLNTQLTAAEKELASGQKAEAKSASLADASA
ncbi:MAG: hypothetical protein Q8O00_02300 [Holophaga sp.]|uniref:hypothetical protein n=1 Tax=Humidesulfovibrio sp. TaxID=2910988 RepID=UPI00276F719B|nr:hypothetical protein [Humidesulfovibrio sp.]MDP2874985.1 hypothetical protein [Holophaga sp.]MDQ7836638.1 hypothetical protein [Humidesulfovibrio sp.]